MNQIIGKLDVLNIGIDHEECIVDKPEGEVKRKTQANPCGKYKCSHCSERNSQKSILKLHQQKHHKDKNCKIVGVGCKDCEKNISHGKCKFSSVEVKKSKICNVKTDDARMITCEKCQAVILKSSLKKHVEIIHKGYVNFLCGGCSYKSYYKNHVTNHQKRKHKDPNMIIVSIDCIYCRRGETHETCLVEKKGNSFSDSTGKYKCSLCGYRSDHKPVVRRHQQKHKDDNCKIIGIGCQYCEKSLLHSKCIFKSSMVNETKVNSMSKTFSCKLCPYESILKSNLFKHLRSEHESKLLEKNRMSLRCEKCNFQTESDQSMLNHKNNVHLLIKKFACPYCELKSYYRHRIHFHLQSKHKGLEDNPILIGCTECESGAKHQICTNGQLSSTIKRENRKMNTEDTACRICNYETINKKQMINHFVLKHDGFSVYSYDKCKYGTNWLSNLANHKSSFHDRKMLECDKCDFTAKWKGPFLEHRRDKHGIFLRPIKFSGNEPGETLCDSCGFSAPTFKSLTLHIRKEHGGRYNKCNDCDYSTPYPPVLRVHKQAKHSSTKYPCDECDYKGTTEMNIKAHIKYKHELGHNYFKCDLCSFATSFPGNFKTHKTKKHGNY